MVQVRKGVFTVAPAAASSLFAPSGQDGQGPMPTEAAAIISTMTCWFRDQGEAVGDEGFRVHPDALKAYDKVIEDQIEQIARIWPKLAAVPLSSDDFGKLPNAHNLYEAYHEHVEAEQHNFADLLEILRHTGDGLQNSATNYESQDHHIDASFGGGQ
ncbi:hypothetical protein ACIBW9_30165 [Streptomyces sp. NPDC049541]|uniref:hypothetical protein n=1 Tax=Streptomyces sp. NPDC049541 TaxID=3365594 RepID=UPI003791D379